MSDNIITTAIKKLSDNLTNKTKKLNVYIDYISNIDEVEADKIINAKIDDLAKIIIQNIIDKKFNNYLF